MWYMYSNQVFLKSAFIAKNRKDIQEIPVDTEWFCPYSSLTETMQISIQNDRDIPCLYHGLWMEKNNQGILIKKIKNHVSAWVSEQGLSIQSDADPVCLKSYWGYLKSNQITLTNTRHILALFQKMIGISTNQISDFSCLSIPDFQFLYLPKKKTKDGTVRIPERYPVTFENFQQAVSYFERKIIDSIILVTVNQGTLNNNYLIERNKKGEETISSSCIDVFHSWFKKSGFAIEMNNNEKLFDRERDGFQGLTKEIISLQDILDQKINCIKNCTGYQNANDLPVKIYYSDRHQLCPESIKLNWHDIPEEKRAFAFRYLNAYANYYRVSGYFAFSGDWITE